MELLSNKDRILQLVQSNQNKLSQELGSLLSYLELGAEKKNTLLCGDLSSPTGIAACTAACLCLEERLATPVPAGLDCMSAVEERRREWTEVRTAFLKKFNAHINNLFIHNVSAEWIQN